MDENQPLRKLPPNRPDARGLQSPVPGSWPDAAALVGCCQAKLRQAFHLKDGFHRAATEADAAGCPLLDGYLAVLNFDVLAAL